MAHVHRFRPQDDAVFIGKNSQIKPRKSEQDQGVKITFLKYDNTSSFLIIHMLFALTRSNLLGQLPDENGIIPRLKQKCCSEKGCRNFETFC
jgi:hypothetical protein